MCVCVCGHLFTKDSVSRDRIANNIREITVTSDFQSCRGAVCPTEVTAQRRGVCDGADMS